MIGRLKRLWNWWNKGWGFSISITTGWVLLNGVRIFPLLDIRAKMLHERPPEIKKRTGFSITRREDDE